MWEFENTTVAWMFPWECIIRNNYTIGILGSLPMLYIFRRFNIISTVKSRSQSLK